MRCSSHFYLGWVSWHIAVTNHVLSSACFLFHQKYYKTRLSKRQTTLSKLWYSIINQYGGYYICNEYHLLESSFEHQLTALIALNLE